MRNIALCYLDLETTGLDLVRDSLYEIALEVELVDESMSTSGPIFTYDTFVKLPPNAHVSEWTKQSANYKSYSLMADHHPSRETAAVYIYESLRMAKVLHDIQEFYIVGANPKFDQEFLERFLKASGFVSSPFRFRAINIEERVAQKLHILEPPGLKECYNLVGLTEPFQAHSAKGDRDAVQRIMHKLMRDY